MKRLTNSYSKIIPRKYRPIFLVISLILTTIVYYSLPTLRNNFSDNTYLVTSIDDGDTIKLLMNGKEETIRFIGVDTPETHDPRKAVQCFGETASNFMKSQVRGAYVRLESDPLSTNRDRYDRLLRYVYKEERLLNAEIIANGYGFANSGFPFTKMETFKALQENAERYKRGLWAECTVTQLDSGQQQTNDAP